MATAGDIIESALRKLGVIASGEEPSSAEQADGLTALNDLVDSFSNESLFIYDDNEETFVLTASQAAYTMGSGGDFDTTRPLKVTKARLKITSSTPNYEQPMNIYSIDEWVNIPVKSQESSQPQGIFVDYAFPLATVNVYPVPSTTMSLILNSMKVIQSFATAATSLTLPPGYNRLLVYNLAMELAPEYGIEPSPNIQRIAIESKANILRLNSETPLSYTDFVQLVNGRKGFNWLTGE